MRDFIGQFVAHNAAGHSLHVRQEVIQRLHFALRNTYGKLCPRPFDEVIEILLRVPQRLLVGCGSLAPDVKIGIEAGLERQDLDLEVFADQQRQRALGRSSAGGVGIEVNDDVLAESSQQPGL